ncbi:unnamed protein product [Penicillium salamii]|nr:unnamed protein product [Penicillium salamii]
MSSTRNPAPNNVMSQPIGGEKPGAEVQLEKKGEINALQRYRYQKWLQNTTDPNISCELLDIEEDLREITQEELSIKEGCPAPGRNPTERLRLLNANFWLKSLKWWYCRSNLEDFELRAFKLWRLNPRWYMHRALVEECIGRQGCCARACGCCQKREISPGRSLGVGHCTLECACCRKSRGFEASSKDKKFLKEQFKSAVKEPSHRVTRYSQVSIWGLVGDSEEDPSNMIDAPPSYDQVKKCKC